MSQTLFFREDGTVSFGEQMAASEQFLTLFKEGMDLVGEAAAYLDGKGREEASILPRAAALAYAVESMRLTTRLMQIASWLLLQRAVNEGELTRAEASSEKRRIHLSRQEAASQKDALAGLPPRLRALVESSLRVQARILHLDGQIYRSGGRRSHAAMAASPVEGQIELLRAAFGATHASSAAM